MKLVSIQDKDIILFTDGSSRGNPGPGGWGTIALYQNGDGVTCVDELGGREDRTTNNRMELQAVIEGIKNFDGYYAKLSDYTATVYLDSAYVLNGVTKWIAGWKRKGWKTGNGKEDVKNQDLWQELDALQQTLKLKFVHIAGHAGIAGNERCDEIATSYADNKPVDLYTGPLSKYTLNEDQNILNVTATAEALQKKAKASSRKSSSSVKAYSYVSFVDGVLHIDSDWKTCEARVKGKSGARFKKSTSPMDEKLISQEFLKKS